MFGSTILDVAIGLIFVYCLYSLLATAINEILSSLFNLRARKLQFALKRMLTDEAPGEVLQAGRLLREFQEHPLIKYMNSGGLFRVAPSYLSASDFSKALIDSLKTVSGAAGAINIDTLQSGLHALDPESRSDTARLLRSYMQDAGDDMAKFRAMIEKWFDSMMVQASGWYKRQSQAITFVVGLALAAGFNASTFTIAGHLLKDNGAREQLAQIASSYLQSHGTDVEKMGVGSTSAMDSLVAYAADLYRNDIAGSQKLLGLGWMGSASANQMDSDHWQLNVIGWLVTALAVSLGSPFWFDLLGKVVDIRRTGRRPKSVDEKGEAR